MDEEFLDDYEKELLEGYELHGIKHDGKSQKEIAKIVTAAKGTGQIFI